MADDKQEPNPVDQLVDLFVYAPIGLLYEYDEVMERLVKRGKSQVALARVVGRLALSGRRAAIDVTEVAETASSALAKAVTEVGAMIGLAPEQEPSPGETGDAPPPPSSPPPPTAEDGAAEDGTAEDEATAEDAETDTGGAGGDDVTPLLPIANYDDLTAKEIIPLLESLSPHQRSIVRAHEEAGRGRKTVLAKLDRLDG